MVVAGVTIATAGMGTVACAFLAGAAGGFTGGFAGTLLNKGSLSDAIFNGVKGACIGAATGLATAGVLGAVCYGLNNLYLNTWHGAGTATDVSWSITTKAMFEGAGSRTLASLLPSFGSALGEGGGIGLLSGLSGGGVGSAIGISNNGWTKTPAGYRPTPGEQQMYYLDRQGKSIPSFRAENLRKNQSSYFEKSFVKQMTRNKGGAYTIAGNIEMPKDAQNTIAHFKGQLFDNSYAFISSEGQDLYFGEFFGNLTFPAQVSIPGKGLYYHSSGNLDPNQFRNNEGLNGGLGFYLTFYKN